MRATILVAVLAAACGKAGDVGGGSGDGDKPSGPEVGAKPAGHTVPSGTIGGKPFKPTVVLLLDNSDGGKLAFLALDEEDARDRRRCEDEPMPEFELTKYHKIEEWQVGKPVESELGDWGATGVDWNAKPKGTAKVTLSKKDPRTFELAGTIEIKGDGWDFSGPFTGEYCPTKSIERPEPPPPMAGTEWTLAPVAVDKAPAAPLQAIIAGQAAAPITHVSVREVGYHDGTRRQRLVFWASQPPDPCSPPPSGGHGRIYSFGKLVKVEGPEFQIDYFTLDLKDPPAAGAALVGNYHHQHGEKKDQILDAALHVFEPDGWRGWMYSQYFSAALAWDKVDDKQASARVYLAVPDSGKSILAGSFTATRCPPEPTDK